MNKVIGEQGNMNSLELRKLQLCLTKMLEVFDDICRRERLTYFMFGGTLLGAVRHKGFIPWDNDIDVAMPRDDFEKLEAILKDKLPQHLKVQSWHTDPACTSMILRIRNMNSICKIAGADFNGSEFTGAFIDVFPLDHGKKENSRYNNVQAFLVKQVLPALAERAGANHRMHGTMKQKMGNLIAGLLPRKKWVQMRRRIMMSGHTESAPYYKNLCSHYNYKKQVFLKNMMLPAIELDFEGHLFFAPNNYDYVLKKFYGNHYMQIPSKHDRHMEDHQILELQIGEEV